MYPAKSLRIVVPFASGGGTDMVARLLGQKLSAAMGQTVIVDNRPGAGGNIGTELVAKAAPDGYTLLAMPSAFSINPGLYGKAPYDPIRDFEPVATLTTYMLFLVAHPSLPARSVKSLIALARAQPGRITYASSGTGTTAHIAGELFDFMTGVRMTHVPYKGSGPSIPAIIGGEVAILFGSNTAVPHAKAGKLVLLGVTGARRSPLFSDVPTVAEAGIPGYDVTSWIALFAPARTPAEIVRRINAEAAKGLRQPDVREMFAAQGLDEGIGSPEALGAMIKAEVPKWSRLIRAAGITVN
jgi:tripartite-type tricarboxylate transporter receptor subunit TctC